MRALVCNVDVGARLLESFIDQQAGGSRGSGAGAGSGADAGSGTRPGRTLGAGSVSTRFGPSPFLELDAFITSHCCSEGGMQGSIRSWVHFADCALMLYNIRGNRWCGRIGRAHASNGIYLSVDMAGGFWCQRCYDPECRGWRSPCRPLPLEVQVDVSPLMNDVESLSG